jgi:ABC-type polysaccharide/polyol phosphate export permease
MGDYLSAVWRCRYFWMALVRMDLRTRYRRSLLGLGWSLLHPIAMTAILCAAFHKIFQADIRTYAPFLLAGLAGWNYIVGVTLSGCQCFYQGESYIRQHPAPMAIYPLRVALGGSIHFLIALGVVIGLVLVVKGPGNLPAIVTVVPSVLLLFVFVWSLAVLAGFANVFFQDTQHLAEIGFQLLFYATPIIYPAETLVRNNLGWLLHYNPLGLFIRLIREPIIDGHPPSVKVFTAACAVVAVMVCAAGGSLAAFQRRLIFHL